MQGRSWKAALTLVAGLGLGFSVITNTVTLADDTTTAPQPTKATAKPKGSPIHSVRVELRIAGLGAKGCEVELKPAHRGCSFETVKKHVDRRGELVVVINEIKVLNADRDCTFAINIKEPGHADRSERRGLRLSKTGGDTPTLSCFLNSPSKIARANETADTKRE